MISVQSFYCNNKSITSYYTTLREILDDAHLHRTRNIVMLTPRSRNAALDSDVEDLFD